MAGKSPSIVNPGTIQEASSSIRPFMTRAKRPKVITEMGRVRSFTIGLMKVLTRPTTIAIKARVWKSLTEIPGTTMVTSHKATALIKKETSSETIITFRFQIP